MINNLRKRNANWRKMFIQDYFLTAVRNRKGHRPLTANKSTGQLTVASYNVHKCVGVDKVFDPERIVHVIQELNADILALQEADKRFGERVGLIDLGYLTRETGLKRVPIKAMATNGLGWHGNALFFRNGDVLDVAQVTLPGVEPRGALIVELEFAEGRVRIIAAHFGLLRYSRAQQVKAILNAIAEREIMPTIMTGDFNEWRIGKRSALSNLAPFFDVTLGTVPSFPSRFPVFALDRMFAFPHELITSIETHLSPLSRLASDHLPIKARIDLLQATKTLDQLVAR